MADEDAALIHDEAREGMEKAIRSLKAELQKFRTGRASVALLDGIQVDYYVESAREPHHARPSFDRGFSL